ncbi:histone-lysine N-methyltransferase PRDM9-like isoform X1 [Dreissena polymorpha]|uniref:histone-lysine N-methyltransferase PRDM9-like isoform X1 n=1 Tax=Dreissena polymorpha TaxID=45954 RepID=UPI0022645E2D|nr:histone-lysine N-methyltransferase PRDM9-like isoform X1 [Dreissena polymorpha]
MLARNPADQCPFIESNASVPETMNADSSNVETIIPTHQLSPSDVSKDANNQLLLGRWYALPFENDDVRCRSHSDKTGLNFEPGSVNKGSEISVFKGNPSVLTTPTLNTAGMISITRPCLDPQNGIFLNPKVMDVKPVLSSLDTDTFHGNEQHGDIYVHSPGLLLSIPSVPSVDSQPSNHGQEANIPLLSLSPLSSQSQYYQQQQPQLVTTVTCKTPQCVFDEIQDFGDHILEEHKLLQSQFGSQAFVLDFVCEQSMPSVPHSALDLTHVFPLAFKNGANAMITSPDQALSISVNPSLTHSFVKATSSQSTNVRGKRDCGDKSIKKDNATNQSIGLSSDKTGKMDQKSAISPMNYPRMPMLSTSEIVNSNLVEESGECSSDDFEEIFIEVNKGKSKSDDSALQSPKRAGCQGLSRGVVKPRGTSVREKAATRNVPPFPEPSKRKLDETCDLVSIKRVKKAKAPEKSKTECSLRERNLASCMNLEPSDDDNLLYCGECKKEFEGDCPVHGPYYYIQDKKVPEGGPDRADHTLPDDLEIKTSKIVGACLGVFSKVRLESGIMFGPYEGDIISDNSKSGYCWQIYKEGKESHFVDAQNKATSNWMRYVNCAMTETDQNLVAFQYKGGIYYCTFKPVSPGDELLVWNRDDYTRELDLIRDNNLPLRPKYVNGKEIYQCVHCKTAFTSAVPYGRHLRTMHGDKLTSNYLEYLDQWLLENDHKYLQKYSKHLHLTTINTKFNIILNVEQKQSDISQSLCDKQLKNAILQKKTIENMDDKTTNHEVCKFPRSNSSHMNTHTRIYTGERLFECEVCSYECNHSVTLKTHMTLHTGEKQYKCEVCSYKCSHRSNLKRHMTLHTGEKPYKCEMCSYKCSQSRSLKTHMMIHTGEKPYKCEVCSYECNRSTHLKTHMIMHTGEKPYKCEVCSYECTTSSNLKRHTRIHTVEKPYKCKVCSFGCYHSDSLKTHMSIHTGEKPYKCEECSYECNHRLTLKTHMTLHTGEKLFKCGVCSYECNQSGILKTHMRIHTGEKPYKCQVCSYEFTHSGNLKRHVRIHTGEKPYKCEVCSYECTHSGTLKMHMRIHTGEKPYKCEMCSYECNRSGSLKTHMRTHTGEKPYKCKVCSYECTHSGSLKTHMRIHTEEKPY